jgi:probable rRNA maturation factor
MIDITLKDVEVPGLDSELFVLWLQRVVKEEGYELGDICLVFCSDLELLEMNKTYLQHDYFTDILTFDYCFDSVVSGDLFISIDRIIDNAILLEEAYFKELKRVCVHGVLHLCGYKDKNEAESKIMRDREEHYIAKFVPRET